jgi:hypothetical protein
MNFTAEEAQLALRQVDQFRDEIVRMANVEGIMLVCETRNSFLGMGWWAGSRSNLPNHTMPDGSGGWAVNEWDPYTYEPGGRAIRTGNDSMLTQPHRQTGFTGTAHPNLTGHRLIADAVVEALRMPGQTLFENGGCMR